MKFLINVVLFQIFWWLLLLLGLKLNGEHFLPHLGLMILCLLVYLVLHFKFVVESSAKEIKILLFSVMSGILLDGTMIFSGLMQNHSEHLLTAMILTLFFIWILFSSTLLHSMLPLRNKPRVFIILCGIFGPLSYIPAMKLDFLIYSEPFYLSYGVHTIMWLGWGAIFSSRLLRV
jgi:hypothetical protein